MKKLFITFVFVAVSLKLYSIGIDASYNVSFVSFANTQISAKNIVYGLGLYTSIRGLNNGSSISGSKEIHNTFLEAQANKDKFEVSYSDGEIFRSGVSFGINKQWKYLFIGIAAGYCDVVEYQKTTIRSDGVSKSFGDQNGLYRKFEYEAMFGAAPEYNKVYIPVYFGWSFNYSTFFGVGIGRKF
jgi:hypothetical protein